MKLGVGQFAGKPVKIVEDPASTAVSLRFTMSVAEVILGQELRIMVLPENMVIWALSTVKEPETTKTEVEWELRTEPGDSATSPIGIY